MGWLPNDDLVVFEQGKGDLVGGIYGDKLELTVIFPTKIEEVQADIDKTIQTGSYINLIDRMKSALDVGTNRFGALYTQRTLKPILETMYGIQLMNHLHFPCCCRI